MVIIQTRAMGTLKYVVSVYVVSVYNNSNSQSECAVIACVVYIDRSGSPVYARYCYTHVHVVCNAAAFTETSSFCPTHVDDS